MSDANANAIEWTVPAHLGPSPAGVAFAEATFAAAWNIQGDPTRPPFADAVPHLFDIALPPIPNATVRRGALTALWLGPTSWLLVGSEPSALANFAAKRDAMNGAAGALFDVTASSVAWSVGGNHAAALLAKDCPLDFHPRAFVVSTCAQSVLGHVNALFYRNDPWTFTVIVARSYARGVWRALCQSAAQYGFDVLPPRPF